MHAYKALPFAAEDRLQWLGEAPSPSDRRSVNRACAMVFARNVHSRGIPRDAMAALLEKLVGTSYVFLQSPSCQVATRHARGAWIARA